MKFYFLYFSLITVLAFTLLACKQENKKQTSGSLDGVYKQMGYGHIAKIESGEFILYDYTNISCLPVSTDSINTFGDNLSLQNDTLRIKDGINLYEYVRIASVPDLCGQKLGEDRKNDPLYNFEVLVATFDDHYAYFELRGVNWDSLKNATKAKITSETSNAELYIILEDMLDSFEDGHISLDAPTKIAQAAAALKTETIPKPEKEVEDIKKYGDLEVAQLVAEHYLSNKLSSSQSELIKWGEMEEDIGYIQINLMMGHANLKLADSLVGMPYLGVYFDELEGLTSEAHTKLEVEGIMETLDQIMNELAHTKAIILDVRFNGGGKDEVGMEIIRHFNPKRQLVFSKKGRMGEGFTKTNDVYLEGSDNPYTKPVYLLTSPQSASATEIMVMSSMLLENVIRIGGHTEGVFSDVLDKLLPNAWEVGLSSEVYEDTRGINYEGKGIRPHINLNYPEDRQEFFRSIANNLASDKQKILGVITTKLE